MPYPDVPPRPRFSRLGAALAIAVIPWSAQAAPGADTPELPVGGQKSNPPGPTPSASAPAPSFPAPFSPAWYESIRFGVQVEGGFVLNPRQRGDSLQFGQVMTDRANIPLFNQLQLTVERVIDPAQTDYDFGFSFQALYGSDARYLHYVGQFDRLIGDRNQLVVRTANVSAHLPWFTSGGLDVKAGEYASPVGYEPYDPALSPFYSHSYIFSWGVPAFHTGILATLHVTPTLDLWAGVDSGTNTGLGYGLGDNNRSGAGVFGIGLNGLLDGKLTVLAITHIGSETPARLSPAADRDTRYFNDLVLSYKFSDTLNFVSELNYVRDTAIDAEAYGIAGYMAWVLNPDLTFNLRGEVWRDAKGYFVAGFPRSLDPIRAVIGLPNTAFGVTPAIPTTYSEITVGVTYKPKADGPVGFAIRPELRYDHAEGGRPFNRGRDRDAVTAAMDIVVSF